MKSFANFFQEAVETLASTEAKNRGLTGNGHGDWYDQQGNFVAKTVKGRLKFFGKGDTLSKDGIPGEELKRSKGNQKANQVQQQPEEEETGAGLVIVLGRFNPPSKNHEALLKAGFARANRSKSEFRIYPSRISDSLANPLNPTSKIEYMQELYPRYADYIVDNEDARTIFDVLASVYEDGYRDIGIVVGQERLGEFQGLVHKMEGQQYEFDNLEVISAGIKDPDSEIEDAGSSSLMRASVAMNDYNKFRAGLPAGTPSDTGRRLFGALKKTMKVSEETEAWRIAPELDEEGLRWNYKNNGLYEVGSLDENLNTGLVGEIIRKGTNYIICVTEEGVMFKSWLRDVREVYEIGTDEYRNYVMSMTPGEKVHTLGNPVVPNSYPTPKKKSINNKRKK